MVWNYVMRVLRFCFLEPQLVMEICKPVPTFRGSSHGCFDVRPGAVGPRVCVCSSLLLTPSVGECVVVLGRPVLVARPDSTDAMLWNVRRSSRPVEALPTARQRVSGIWAYDSRPESWR